MHRKPKNFLNYFLLSMLSFQLHAGEKRLYFSPGGTAPTGKHQLSAYEKNGKASYYIESLESNSIVSEPIGVAPKDGVDIRGYIPWIASWTARIKDGVFGISGDFVAIMQLDEKQVKVTTLTRDKDGFFKKYNKFNHEKLLKNIKDAVFQKAIHMGGDREYMEIKFVAATTTKLEKKHNENNFNLWKWEPYASTSRHPQENLVRIVYKNENLTDEGQTAFSIASTYTVTDSRTNDQILSARSTTQVLFTINPTLEEPVNISASPIEIEIIP